MFSDFEPKLKIYFPHYFIILYFYFMPLMYPKEIIIFLIIKMSMGVKYFIIRYSICIGIHR